MKLCYPYSCIAKVLLAALLMAAIILPTQAAEAIGLDTSQGAILATSDVDPGLVEDPDLMTDIGTGSEMATSKPIDDNRLVGQIWLTDGSGFFAKSLYPDEIYTVHVKVGVQGETDAKDVKIAFSDTIIELTVPTGGDYGAVIPYSMTSSNIKADASYIDVYAVPSSCASDTYFALKARYVSGSAKVIMPDESEAEVLDENILDYRTGVRLNWLAADETCEVTFKMIATRPETAMTADATPIANDKELSEEDVWVGRMSVFCSGFIGGIIGFSGAYIFWNWWEERCEEKKKRL